MSLDLIIPFLAPLDEYILRKDVTEVMINDDGKVFVEIGGAMKFVGTNLVSEENIERAVERAARLNNNDINAENPRLDTTLPDGSRVAAVHKAFTCGNTSLAIRKFRPSWFTMDQLVDNGTLPDLMAKYLSECVVDRKSILVSGGTSSGKTTLVKSLINAIPEDERIGIIEDTREIQADNLNVFRFIARQGINATSVTIRDLVKSSLRFRPDRIIIGEVRGGEAADLLDALNTGHEGSISTIHANSSAQALKRLAILAMRGEDALPLPAIQEQIKDLIDISVHVSHMPDKTRKVVSIVERGEILYAVDDRVTHLIEVEAQ